MKRLLWFLIAGAASCGDRVPEYQGAPFPHDPPPPSLIGRIVTTNNGDDTLSVIDVGSAAPVQRVPVGFNPVELEGPHHVSVDPAGAYVYVNLSLAVVGSGTGPHGSHGGGVLPGWVLKLETTKGREVGRVQVEPNPGDNTITADGKTLFVTHYDAVRWAAAARAVQEKTRPDLRSGDSNLYVIDTESMKVKARVPLCPAAHGVRLSADQSTLFATCGPDEIAVVDLRDATFPVRRVLLEPNATESGTCGICPYALAVAPDGTVWVSGLGTNGGTTGRGAIYIYDPILPGGGNFDQARTLPLRGSAVFAAFVGTSASFKAYVPEQVYTSQLGSEAVRIYEVVSGTPPHEVASIPLDPIDCQKPHMLLIEAGQGQLICEGDHTRPGSFAWLDLDGQKVTKSVPIGVFPDGLARVPGAALSR